MKASDLLRIAIFACGVALLLALVLNSGVWLNFVMMALYAALLAQAWNILGGYGGQFSFGHALFFGTGAYVQAIAQLQWGSSLAGAAAGCGRQCGGGRLGRGAELSLRAQGLVLRAGDAGLCRGLSHHGHHRAVHRRRAWA
jgi:ABC-type branched-subunit amino acid transport system permease subunit